MLGHRSSSSTKLATTLESQLINHFFPASLLIGTILEPHDKTLPDKDHRPWYMKEGQIRPSSCPISEETGQRIAKVLPDEAPGEDRIPDQLMYVPPEGFVPENMEDTDVPLKTILMWNGLGSWGGLRPGRGVFIKEQCPVSSCVISSSRIDGQKADLVVFKVSRKLKSLDVV